MEKSHFRYCTMSMGTHNRHTISTIIVWVALKFRITLVATGAKSVILQIIVYKLCQLKTTHCWINKYYNYDR